jgi:outer membrane protein TolC
MRHPSLFTAMGRVLVIALWGLWLTAISAPFAWAAEPAGAPPATSDTPGAPEPTSQEPITLSLDQALHLALEQSLELQIVQKTLNAAETDPTVERAKFDPSFTANTSSNRSINPAGDTQTHDVTLSLDQPVMTGGTLSLSFDNNWTKTTSGFTSLQTGGSGSFYQSSLNLIVTQPLLKGGGLAVNRAPILIAANNASTSNEAVKQKAQELVANVERAYWNLVLQRKIFQVKQEALRAAKALLEAARAKVEQGVLASIEALVAQAGAASQEEAVVVAERAVHDAQDQLRRFFTPTAASLTNEAVIIPLDEPDPEPREINLAALTQAALEDRPELVQAKLDLANSRLNLALAQNQQWPTLNLQGSAGLNGIGDSLANKLTSADFYQWQAGLTLTVPLGNRSANATALKRRFEMERSSLQLKDKEQSILLEVKEAARGAVANSKRVAVTRQARRLAEKKLEAQQARFELGLTTVQDVLTFERDLAEAKQAEIQAAVDYRNSLVDLDQRTGRLLGRHQITPINPIGPAGPPGPPS